MIYSIHPEGGVCADVIWPWGLLISHHGNAESVIRDWGASYIIGPWVMERRYMWGDSEPYLEFFAITEDQIKKFCSYLAGFHGAINFEDTL